MYKNNNWRVLGFTLLLLVIMIVTASTVQAQVNEQLNCQACHEEASFHLERSEHRFLSCRSCHTDIEDYPHHEGVSIDKKESVQICASCHQGDIVDSYEQSFHGKAVYLGSQKSASCVDCHGAHDVLGEEYSASKVNKENVSETCAGCHGQASAGFAQGSEHFMLKSAGPGAPMYYTAKFFVWLTIIVVTALIIHIEMQLFHNLRRILRENKK